MVCEPEICRVSLSPEGCEFLVLATDGVWDVLNNEEVQRSTLHDFHSCLFLLPDVVHDFPKGCGHCKVLAPTEH